MSAAFFGERLLSIGGAFPPETFTVERLSGRESLGHCFEYDAVLLSDSPLFDIGSLIGDTVAIQIHRGEKDPRYLHGYVTRAALVGTFDRHARYTIRMVPWFQLMSGRVNNRVFQNQSVPDMAKALFREHGFVDFEDQLSNDYPERDFVVQHRESDFSFVSRLLEKAGIYYFFRHEKGRHVLVLADSQSAHQEVPGSEVIAFHPDGSATPISGESVNGWEFALQWSPFTVASSDFDFERPRADLSARAKGPDVFKQADLEVFDFPAGYTEQSEVDTYVRGRLVAQLGDAETYAASGEVQSLGAGDLFSLSDFPIDDQNQQYLIVSASFEALNNAHETGTDDEAGYFRSAFTVMDAVDSYRPPMSTPIPRVDGPQTAIVVGEAGEEITTDKYGRVKVQFHWDRVGTSDEKSSCWVRVAQVWAGSGWGGMHIPRIGQEVIVEFLEGDPDRPIITGRVYNADNMPPYALPDNKTQSGIKSRSTKGGGPGNFNEIRFEDKKGSEELHIQAEKDQSTHVKHNQSISVDGDRSVSVGGNETISVTGTRTSTITKKETQTFKADREMRVTGNDLEDVTGHRTENHHAGREITVEQGDALTVVGSDKVDTIHGNYDITADTSFQVSQKSNKLLIEDAVTIESVGDIDIKNSGCEVSAQNAGALLIEAKQNIQLKCGPATITLNMDGTIELDGVTGISAKAGTSTLTLDPSGASVKGTAVELNGTAGVVVQAPIIKVG